VTYTKHPGVDAYIENLPPWQQTICRRRVRDPVHGADPQVQEMTKRRAQPYFVLEGNFCAPLATKDHVNVFLHDGGIVPDPEHIITGGHDNKTARTVAIYRDQTIDEPALTASDSSPRHTPCAWLCARSCSRRFRPPDTAHRPGPRESAHRPCTEHGPTARPWRPGRGLSPPSSIRRTR
jgi:hypothetical protein